MFRQINHARRVRSFWDDLGVTGSFSRHSAGPRTIPVAHVVGSVGRDHELRRNFMPRPSKHGEARFRSILTMMDQGAPLPPIDVYQLGHRYYVLDGHHRIAAARKIGMLEIDAVVTEFLPVSDTWQEPAA